MHGKRIIVVGAGSGIGKGIVLTAQKAAAESWHAIDNGLAQKTGIHLVRSIKPSA